MDTGGGENNSNAAAGGGDGRAAAALAERCGVRALPAFQVWRGGELRASLGGAEAAAVVVSEEEAAAEAEEQRRGVEGRAEAFLRKAGGRLASRLQELAGKRPQRKKPFPVSLRTRLTAELRQVAGAPIPSPSLLSKFFFTPIGRAYGQRWRLAAAAAALAAARAVAGSVESSKNSKKWEEGTYEWLPTPVHKKAVRAAVVARYMERQVGLGAFHFLAPVSEGFFFCLSYFFLFVSFVSLFFLFNSGERKKKLNSLSPPTPPLSPPPTSPLPPPHLSSPLSLSLA